MDVTRLVGCVQCKMTQCYTLYSCAPEMALPELYTAVIFVSFPKVFLTIRTDKTSADLVTNLIFLFEVPSHLNVQTCQHQEVS